MTVALGQFNRVNKSVDAMECGELLFESRGDARRQPKGLTNTSRGLSVSDTPGTLAKTNPTLEGCQK